MKKEHTHGGYTLIELIVAVGLFAIVMMLASGAYLVMININRQTQGIAVGIDNLSFALETMTRTIRTGTNYSCSTSIPHTDGSPCLFSTFSVTDSMGHTVSYTMGSTGSGGNITQTTSSGTVNSTAPLTDSSTDIISLKFYAIGTQPYPDTQQARVTIVISGTVSSGPGTTIPFTVETGATMRGSDI